MTSKDQIPYKILKAFTIIAMILLILATVHFHLIGKATDLEFYKGFIGLIEIIIVEFLTGAIALIIPQLLPFRRFDIEMRKEAREKYSQAKTEIDHLAYSLQFIASAQEALTLIKDIHIKKHLAETYPEFLPDQNTQKKCSLEKIWSPKLMPYECLAACRNKIQDHIVVWSTMPPATRFTLLPEAIKDEKAKVIKEKGGKGRAG